MDKALTELIRISKMAGKDNSLVQGGGGNTSVKTVDGKYMYIKASGTALKEMSQRKGWRRLKLDSVLAILKDKSIGKLGVTEREKEIVGRLNLCLDDDIETDSRPSVESHLHAILDGYVVHLHALAVDAYVCAKRGRVELEKLFKDEKLPPLWVPYADPGWTLAMKMAGLVEGYKSCYGRKPRIMFLEKHGLFVSASTANAVLQLVCRVIRMCNSKLKGRETLQAKRPEEFALRNSKNFQDSSPRNLPRGICKIPGTESSEFLRNSRGSDFRGKNSRDQSTRNDDIAAAKLAIGRAFFQVTGQNVTVEHFLDGHIAGFLARKDAKRLVSFPALTPDGLVYSGGPPMWLEKGHYKTIIDKLNRQISRGEKLPFSFLVGALGLFVAGNEKTIPVIKDVVTVSLLIRSFAANFGGVNPLNRRQRQFINEWEMETYRHKVAGGADSGQMLIK